MPGVPGLAVGVHQLVHQPVFGHLGYAGRDQLARLHLVHMAVPERLLGLGQSLEQPFANDVLDAHQLGIGDIAVVDHALEHLFAQDAAIVMGLHLAVGMAVVEVEAVQVGVEGGDGRLALQDIGAGFEHPGIGLGGGTRHRDRRLGVVGGLGQRSAGEQQQGGESAEGHGAFSTGACRVRSPGRRLGSTAALGSSYECHATAINSSSSAPGLSV